MESYWGHPLAVGPKSCWMILMWLSTNRGGPKVAGVIPKLLGTPEVAIRYHTVPKNCRGIPEATGKSLGGCPLGRGAFGWLSLLNGGCPEVWRTMASASSATVSK